MQIPFRQTELNTKLLNTYLLLKSPDSLTFALNLLRLTTLVNKHSNMSAVTFLKMDWKSIFFPIFRDIQEINKETDTGQVAKNNSELAANEEKFNTVLRDINLKKHKAMETKDK
jgi:hypothetical protein